MYVGISDMSSKYKLPYGNWYLALAAVKRGDNDSAIRYLDLIPATDPYLTTKAQELRATL